MGKSTISMAMFNSFLYVYQRVSGKLGMSWYINLYPFLLVKSLKSSIGRLANQPVAQAMPGIKAMGWDQRF